MNTLWLVIEWGGALILLGILVVGIGNLVGQYWRDRRKEEFCEGVESAIDEPPTIYTSGVFRCISSMEIKAHEEVVVGPDGLVQGFVGDERSVFGIAAEASVPILDDPDGLHEVMVDLGPCGFVDMNGKPFVVTPDADWPHSRKRH